MIIIKREYIINCCSSSKYRVLVGQYKEYNGLKSSLSWDGQRTDTYIVCMRASLKMDTCRKFNFSSEGIPPTVYLAAIKLSRGLWEGSRGTAEDCVLIAVFVTQ